MMKIATFNTNSIRARMPIITRWLEEEYPDVLCLQETKVQDRDFPLKDIEPAGYEVAYRGQKSYNGVAIISRHPIKNPRYHLFRGEEDARFIEGEIKGIHLINVYVPQGYAPESEKFQYKLAWFRKLIDYVKGRFRPDSPLVIAGDFNVAMDERDVYDPEGMAGNVGFHPAEQALMKELTDWGLEDLFRRQEEGGGHYTFWDYRIPNALKRKMGWRIDYILCTSVVAECSVKTWIDIAPRSLQKPSDHTFLITELDK